MEFKKLIFDIDDTLYDYAIAHQAGMNEVSGVCTKWDISQEQFAEHFTASRKHIHMQLLGLGASHHRLLYFQGLLERAGKFSAPRLLELYDAYWNTFLENMEVFEGVYELFEELDKQNIQTCILTDLTAHIQFRKIIKLGLEGSLKLVVSSEEAGHEKPHPFMFESAMKKLQAGPGDVIMVGDNFNKDILGAHNCGIRSIWLNRSNTKTSLPPTAVSVTSFKEINSLLL